MSVCGIMLEQLISKGHDRIGDVRKAPTRSGVDCPLDWELIRLAARPKGADPFTPQHLTCCSPCFNRYMEILAYMKRSKAG
jgi:hypothetical protein